MVSLDKLSLEYSEMTKLFSDFAERANGRYAMLGFVAALGAYATTGQIIPGVF